MIQFKDVSKTFKSKGVTTQALQHVSLTIDDGDMFGVIGFSAGKSTLLRMVNGLEMPTEGHVEINGQDLSKISHNEMRKLRKSIGMVFQQFNLLDSRTVFDNVAIPLRLNKKRIKTRCIKRSWNFWNTSIWRIRPMLIRVNFLAGKSSVLALLAHWLRIRLFSYAMKRQVHWIRKRRNRFCSSLNGFIKS